MSIDSGKKTGLLGLDVGTTSTKAVLFDPAGNELVRAVSRPYTNLTPKTGWVEQDPEEIWQAVLDVLRQIAATADGKFKYWAICMAVQSGSVLPADHSGKPIYPLITWMDGRTDQLVSTWKKEGLQEKVRPISGWSLYPGLPLPTIAWLHENDPDTYKKAQHYFSLNDFITFRLTGKQTTNPSNAGGMQLVDIPTGEWSQPLCSLAHITPLQLSKIEPAGTVIGKIQRNLCNTIGISENSVLVNGGHDQVITALGLGINDPGKFLLACGTAWVYTGVATSPEVDKLPSTLDLNIHVPPNRWTISQSLGGLGASLEWWVQQAWHGARSERFANLDADLKKSHTQPGLFFIPMTGGHDDPATTRPGGFSGLTLSHQRADMAHAVMESAGFELCWALQELRSAGHPVNQLWMVGGAANSEHWPTILANITGIPISLPAYDNWPALGAALLAGVGVGVFDDIGGGLENFGKLANTIDPDQKLRGYYEDQFASYQQTVTKMHDLRN
jgi:xylulokinase